MLLQDIRERARRGSWLLLTAVIICCVLNGCIGKSPTPNFYILTSVAEDAGKIGSLTPSQDYHIGLGPVDLADYLDQPKLVIRTNENQLVRAEFEQWGGALKENITSVIAENIALLQSTQKVHIYPWRLSTPMDYQITVDIVRFDGTLKGEAWLIARWNIMDARRKIIIATRRTSIHEPVTTADYGALVAAQSRLLSRLSREIAETLSARNSGNQENRPAEKKNLPLVQ